MSLPDFGGSTSSADVEISGMYVTMCILSVVFADRPKDLQSHRGKYKGTRRAEAAHEAGHHVTSQKGIQCVNDAVYYMCSCTDPADAVDMANGDDSRSEVFVDD